VQINPNLQKIEIYDNPPPSEQHRVNPPPSTCPSPGWAGSMNGYPEDFNGD